jgi:hypothetical protein
MVHIAREGSLIQRTDLLWLTPAILFLAATTAGASDSGAVVPAAEHTMPLPWGLGLTVYSQSQEYDIISLEVPLAGLDIGAAEGLDIENTTETFHVKFDYWLLPFLNVYVLGGSIDGTTRVKLSGVDLGLPIVLNDLKIEYSGVVYGGGATLAVGGTRWFGSLTYDLTRTDLDVSTSTVKAWVVSPRVGLVFGGAAVWAGAMYQNTEEIHEGLFEMPLLGTVPYYVELEQSEPWNYLVGMQAGLGEHWSFSIDGGFGTRKAVLAQLEYRFGSR